MDAERRRRRRRQWRRRRRRRAVLPCLSAAHLSPQQQPPDWAAPAGSSDPAAPCSRLPRGTGSWTQARLCSPAGTRDVRPWVCGGGGVFWSAVCMQYTRTVCTVCVCVRAHPSPVEGPGQVVPSAQRQHGHSRLGVQLQLVQSRQDPAHLNTHTHTHRYTSFIKKVTLYL